MSGGIGRKRLPFFCLWVCQAGADGIISHQLIESLECPACINANKFGTGIALVKVND